MTAISKTTIRLNEFKESISTKTRASVSKIDLKINALLKPMIEFFNSANKPIALNLLKDKTVIQKEGKDVECAVECCQCCAESTRGCCWASG